MDLYVSPENALKIKHGLTLKVSTFDFTLPQELFNEVQVKDVLEWSFSFGVFTATVLQKKPENIIVIGVHAL